MQPAGQEDYGDYGEDGGGYEQGDYENEIDINNDNDVNDDDNDEAQTWPQPTFMPQENINNPHTLSFADNDGDVDVDVDIPLDQVAANTNSDPLQCEQCGRVFSSKKRKT